jgi:hypothetical protein
MKLNDTERLHFWVAGSSDTGHEAHNHRYDFVSTVLKGEIEEEMWTWRKRPVERDRVGDWNMWQVSCTEGEDAKMLFSVNVRTEFRSHHAGDTYMMLQDEFHSSQAMTNTVTYLRRGPILAEYANV